MNRYQLTFLASLKLEAEQAIQYQDKIINQLKELGAELEEAPEIKEQSLVYPIHGERKVWLGCLIFVLDPEKIVTVEGMLNHEKNILRHMISRQPAEDNTPVRRRTRPQIIKEPAASTEKIKKETEGLDKKINEILDW